MLNKQKIMETYGGHSHYKIKIVGVSEEIGSFESQLYGYFNKKKITESNLSNNGVAKYLITLRNGAVVIYESGVSTPERMNSFEIPAGGRYIDMIVSAPDKYVVNAVSLMEKKFGKEVYARKLN